MERSTIELLTEYNIDPKNTAIKQYYDADNIWKTLRIERDEIKHSAFLAWLFGLDVSSENSPLIMLLNLLVMRSTDGQMDSRIKTAVLKAQLKIKSAAISTEMAVSRLSKLVINDRLDIYSKCDVDGVEGFSQLEIIMENKVEAPEGAKGSSQTQCYYQACHENRKDESTGQIFVFLSGKDQNPKDDHFIRISYQDLVDYILEPYLKNNNVDSHTEMFIKEYLRILGNPYNKNNTILATTMEEKELLKDFYMRNEKLFKRAIDVMIETTNDVEERSDFVEMKNLINKTSRSHRVYTINGKGNYSMYEVIEEFAKDQMKNGKTIQDVDDIFWQYVGNGRRQRMVMVSDVKTNVYRYQYERNGKTYEHVHEFRFNGSDYYCMKEWEGKINGNFQRLMNGINLNYPGFQIA